MGHDKIESYAAARKLYNSVTPWRGHTDRPWAKRTHNTKRMREFEPIVTLPEYNRIKGLLYRFS